MRDISLNIAWMGAGVVACIAVAGIFSLGSMTGRTQLFEECRTYGFTVDNSVIGMGRRYECRPVPGEKP